MANRFTPNPSEVIGDTAYVYLKGGYVVTVDAIDLPLVAQYRWYAKFVAHTNRKVIASVCSVTSGKNVMMHRLIAAQYADITDRIIDHEDRSPLNNKRDNLRIVGQRENLLNRKAWGQSGFKGVVLVSEKPTRYKVQVNVFGKAHYGGYYSDLIEAAHASDRLSVKLRGDKLVKGSLNFPHKYDSYVSGSL